jgi:predicted subunit of tRNA(5-methylaminomethyl-2-thiouridylate) methyltransferase
LYQMLDNMKSHEKNMAEHAATVRAFYVALTEAQKNVFNKHFQERHARHSRVNK